MGYYIDLESISIDAYKEILKTADLIPSWMVLKENIDENLDIIKKHNIKNIGELKEAIVAFVKYYNHHRYHEGPGDVNPYNIYTGRRIGIPHRRKEVKSRIL